MSEKEEERQDQAQEPSKGTPGRRRPRSGEGMESVLAHLREQESQRVQDDRSRGAVTPGN
ncbi:hypothetical protein EZ313_00150 [Ramlibacter henchirensis]|uniref:Uncharacterized protein n=1 Tax=Ramlibacter henchirensis TaxID=204072 RepID=A0A4Z0C1M7_9BURK|nr:hypothetical protein [Ramlibacter henchirensis]TFZ05131.1 hypothetical protein EZ313_00150 [Ramlibacter henchirensis]